MSEAIIVALITSGVTLIGIIASHVSTMDKLDKQSAVADEKINGRINVLQADIRTLSNRVEAHNKVVDRTYALERKADVLDEKIKVANDRIGDLERSGNHD